MVSFSSSLSDFSRILQFDPDDVARVHGIERRIDRRRAIVIERHTQQAIRGAQCNEAFVPLTLERHGKRIRIEQLLADRLEVHADVHVQCGKASSAASVSIVERQPCTFTLKRNGPFGDEQVPGT